MELETNIAKPRKIGLFRHYVLMQDISPDPKVRKMRQAFWVMSIVCFIMIPVQFSPSLLMKHYFANGSHLKVANGKIQAALVGSRRGQKTYNPIIYVNNQPIGINSPDKCGYYDDLDKMPLNTMARVWYMNGAIYQMEDVYTKQLILKRCSIANFIQLTNNATKLYLKVLLTQLILIFGFCLRFNELIRQLGNDGVTDENKPIRVKLIWLGMRFFFYNLILIGTCTSLFSIFNFMR